MICSSCTNNKNCHRLWEQAKIAPICNGTASIILSGFFKPLRVFNGYSALLEPDYPNVMALSDLSDRPPLLLRVMWIRLMYPFFQVSHLLLHVRFLRARA